jgi:glycosyltransferase involved in cell wall biosynthesis
VVVTGGAHTHGGQDRANLELVKYLSEKTEAGIHVVTHEVAPDVLSLPRVHVDIVPRPARSIALGERLLERTARRIHARIGDSAIVLANGGNYPHAFVNWVHSVHAVWPVRDEGAPLFRKAFNRMKKWDARQRERRALRSAELLLANSERTERDLVDALGVARERIRIVRFGADVADGPSEPNLGELRIGFIGALGWDRNKGLDVVLETLRVLRDRYAIPAMVIVAGAGSLAPWVQVARSLGLEHRVRFLGMVEDVPALLRGLDLLLSPVHYEAYGLAIQEALVAGVPAIISSAAGIASLVRQGFPQLVITEGSSVETWAAAVASASRDLSALRSGVAKFGASLAERSWEAMAQEIVQLVEGRVAELAGKIKR